MEKKVHVVKQTIEKVDTDVKLNTGEVKDEQKSQSKFLEWHVINSIIKSLPAVARKDAFESMEYLLKEKHILLNKNFAITNLN